MIAEISNGEGGLSVRNKLNTVIDEVNTNILTINDGNVATYIGTGTGSSNTYIINVPANTDIISIETTANQKFYGIQFASVVNGKRVTIVGNSNTEFACSGSETAVGRFSQYLYGYLAGVSGGSTNKLIEVLIDFLYWNGIMYSKAY